MVCGKPLYFFKITVVSLHFHCLSAVCICSEGKKSEIKEAWTDLRKKLIQVSLPIFSHKKLEIER